MFDQFMKDVCGNNEALESILLEFTGYILANKSCSFDKSLILTGEGSNGKSTFMKVLKKLVGAGNYSVISTGDFSKETHRQGIDGKLFNLFEETPSHSFLEGGLFKNLSTGGEHVVRKLYKNPYTIENTCKFVFTCNKLPMTKDLSHGFFRRLQIVPFNQKFEGKRKDRYIAEKLYKELPGIFNKCLRAYASLIARGDFVVTQAVEDVVTDYKLEQDNIASWMDECVVFDEIDKDDQDRAKHAKLSDMYSEYKIYCDVSNEKPYTKNGFSRRLSSLIKDIAVRRTLMRFGDTPHRVLMNTRVIGNQNI